MKNTLLVVAVAAASFSGLVAAKPFDQDLVRRLAEADKVANEGMKWSGEIFPGKTYNLTGDVESLMSQILEINPDYKANHTESEAQIAERRLLKRNKDNGNCGDFSTAVADVTRDNYGFLRDIGGVCQVAGRSCIRMACRATSGLYLCNDNAGPIQPNCNYLASYVNDIQVSCLVPNPFPRTPLSGQEFDTDRYNVVVAYANCNVSPSFRPADYVEYGPNGFPSVVCRGCIRVQPR